MLKNPKILHKRKTVGFTGGFSLLIWCICNFSVYFDLMRNSFYE